MRFWKRKIPRENCEHEWHLAKKPTITSHYELYCPKCNKDIFTNTLSDANAYILKSKLRNEYLENLKKRAGYNMSIQVSVEVTQCDNCPHAEVRRVWTNDPWDNVRAIECKQLGEDAYSYLDWYDKSPIPNKCPFRGDKI